MDVGAYDDVGGYMCPGCCGAGGILPVPYAGRPAGC